MEDGKVVDEVDIACSSDDFQLEALGKFLDCIKSLHLPEAQSWQLA